MRTRTHFGRSVLLAALVIGLNVLCLFGWAHGRHVQRHARVNYTQIPPHGSHRPTIRGNRASSGSSASDVHTADHASSHVAPKYRPTHTPPVMHAAVALLSTAPSFEPERSVTFLRNADVLARGSAPRGPSAARAPPLA